MCTFIRDNEVVLFAVATVNKVNRVVGFFRKRCSVFAHCKLAQPKNLLILLLLLLLLSIQQHYGFTKRKGKMLQTAKTCISFSSF